MAKMIVSLAAAGLLSALVLPGPASAADTKRADGLTNKAPQATEFSSRNRRWHRRAHRRWHRRWHRPRVVRRYYRYPRYYAYYAPYPYYYYRPYWYYRPGFSFFFGF